MTCSTGRSSRSGRPPSGFSSLSRSLPLTRALLLSPVLLDRGCTSTVTCLVTTIPPRLVLPLAPSSASCPTSGPGTRLGPPSCAPYPPSRPPSSSSSPMWCRVTPVPSWTSSWPDTFTVFTVFAVAGRGAMGRGALRVGRGDMAGGGGGGERRWSLRRYVVMFSDFAVSRLASGIIYPCSSLYFVRLQIHIHRLLHYCTTCLSRQRRKPMHL